MGVRDGEGLRGDAGELEPRRVDRELRAAGHRRAVRVHAADHERVP